MEIKEIKILFGKSGNKCAFPNCNHNLIDENNNIMCEMAHIEARSNNGPRANKTKTIKERNKAENLICLCYNHHKVIDKYKDKYTVDVLRKMKQEHEEKYSGTHSFDYDKIFEINRDFFDYIDRMKKINYNTPPYIPEELRKKIKFHKDFDGVIKYIKANIKYIRNLHLDIIKYFEELNEKILSNMKELGYETLIWENQDDNDFIAPFWEEMCIGGSNCFDDIKIYLTYIEILYYIEFLKTNEDKEVEKRLDRLKYKFEKMCRDACYYD